MNNISISVYLYVRNNNIINNSSKDGKEAEDRSCSENCACQRALYLEIMFYYYICLFCFSVNKILHVITCVSLLLFINSNKTQHNINAIPKKGGLASSELAHG